MATNNKRWQRLLNILWEGTADPAGRPAPPTDTEIYQQIYAIPGADEYKRAADALQRKTLLWAAIMGVLMGVLYTIMGLDNIAFPIVLLCAVLLTGLIWRYPAFVFFVVMTLCCLIETFPKNYTDALTDRVPLWYSGNMVVSFYTGQSLELMPLNLFEIMMIYVGVIGLVRMSYMRNISFYKGDFFYPILGYLVWVGIGEIHGMATGGDFLISLQEIRAQIYFFVGYSLAVNLIESRKQINATFWIMGICIGIKGILYTYRQYVTLHGVPLSDQGVGSHEEAFFFDLFIAMLVIFLFTNTHKNLRRIMLVLLPLVIMGNIATNRRAGTAAILIAAPALVAGAYAAYPKRRGLITGLAVTGAVLAYPYYQVFKNSSMSIAQPARAVRSHYEPSQRDKSSNRYRDTENLNIFYTIKEYPLGYGYGKPFLNVVGMVDITRFYKWALILPHNQILWVWMRVGTQGFVLFWIMISVMLIRSVFYIRRRDISDEDRATGMITIVTLPMLLIFGLYDLQLSNYRDMLVASMLAGLTCARIREIPAWDWRKGPDATEPSPAETGRARIASLQRRA